MSGDDVRAFATRLHDHGEAYGTAVDISAHTGASDPHTGYQKESEKQAASGYPGLDASGFVVGNGLSFPATQVPSSGANVFDDYEEGDWTPTFGSAGGGSPTMASQYGRYQKTGRWVTATCALYGYRGSLAAGNLVVAGLPFVAAATQANWAGWVGYVNGIDLPSGYTVRMQMVAGDNIAYLMAETAGDTVYMDASTNLPASGPYGHLIAGITYEAAD